jgi:hypothetical protein
VDKIEKINKNKEYFERGRKTHQSINEKCIAKTQYRYEKTPKQIQFSANPILIKKHFNFKTQEMKQTKFLQLLVTKNRKHESRLSIHTLLQINKLL